MKAPSMSQHVVKNSDRSTGSLMEALAGYRAA